ncbi:MAG: SDR family NAD(P)-dependent oxidoreductase [Anaerolineae bacterium]
MTKVVLITGASMGIGQAIAKALAARGYRVFGTSRKPVSETLDGFELLPLDVTSDESVRDCVQTVIQRAGRIDVLVNNAGVDFIGALEETSMEEARWVMETNFFGVVRMVQAVLPYMRPQRSGHIINISSGFGQVAFPFEAMYCASKHALEAYSEGLYYEMMLWNIRVNCVEPGFYHTPMAYNKRLPGAPMPLYDTVREKYVRLFEWSAEHGGDPAAVGRHVLRLVDTPSQQLRHPVGWEAVLVTRLSLVPLLTVPGSKAGRWYFGMDDFGKDMRRYLTFGALAVSVGSVLAFLRRALKR